MIDKPTFLTQGRAQKEQIFEQGIWYQHTIKEKPCQCLCLKLLGFWVTTGSHLGLAGDLQ